MEHEALIGYKKYALFTNMGSLIYHHNKAACNENDSFFYIYDYYSQSIGMLPYSDCPGLNFIINLGPRSLLTDLLMSECTGSPSNGDY